MSKNKNKIKNILDKYEEDVSRQIDSIMDQSVKEIVEEMKTKVPVDSGRLRNSISSEKVDDYSYVVRASADYAPYVEFGTIHTPAQPFFQPVVDKKYNEMIVRIKKMVGGK